MVNRSSDDSAQTGVPEWEHCFIPIAVADYTCANPTSFFLPCICNLFFYLSLYLYLKLEPMKAHEYFNYKIYFDLVLLWVIENVPRICSIHHASNLFLKIMTLQCELLKYTVFTYVYRTKEQLVIYTNLSLWNSIF
jgi:hypothetical protein